MSVMNSWGIKVVLPRVGRDQIWDDLREAYAGNDRQKWKSLAMLALRVNAGWSLDMIASAFGHPRGHVSRSLSALTCELKERFDWTPDEEEGLAP